MEINEVKSAVEAIVFAAGEPIPVARIAEALDVEKSMVRRAADLLVPEYETRGITLLWLDDCLQFATRPEHEPYIRTVLEQKRNQPLSQAAMEVLAIAAYHQPVTKGYIEQVRGVECGSVVNTLVEKGLLEEAGRMDLPGRPILYSTTKNFLRCFKLSSLEELPQVLPDQPTDMEREEMVALFDDDETDIETEETV